MQAVPGRPRTRKTVVGNWSRSCNNKVGYHRVVEDPGVIPRSPHMITTETEKRKERKKEENSLEDNETA